ncbi:hypothetical protein NDU88_004469 [Pleurodeles waltl]|uniref:Secreted protein n=1 Tax=Pleurodeles waltl TaxID=8319 RepID=A0AAV7L4U9_PLEWA|nr:hypothetical protein NDU88_004469 [Pleurodeles waltl]
MCCGSAAAFTPLCLMGLGGPLPLGYWSGWRPAFGIAGMEGPAADLLSGPRRSDRARTERSPLRASGTACGSAGGAHNCGA